MGTGAIEPSGSVKFDSQTFILTYYDEVANFFKKNEKEYPILLGTNNNCIYALNNTKQIPMSQLVAMFNGTADISKFLSLKTHQYSALIPKVRLFRVEFDDSGKKKYEREFIFNKDYKYELNDIFNSPKRDNSGIKRINWKLAGSNPVTAEKQVEVEIELYFDSINSFSGGDFDEMKKRWIASKDKNYEQNFYNFTDTDTTTRNYWSLLFHPKNISNNDEYNTYNYRIKASIGWEDVEPNIKNQLFPETDINEEIKKLNYSFLLNLVEHKFNFNEDGSLTLTATYFAQFENVTHNYNFNILGDLKRQLDNLKNRNIRDLYSELAVAEGISATPTAEDIIDSLGLSSFGLSKEQKEGLENIVYNLKDADIKYVNSLLSDDNKLKCFQETQQFTVDGSNPQQLPQVEQKQLLENFEKITNYYNELSTRSANFTKAKYYKLFINKIIDSNIENVWGVRITKDEKTKWENWFNSSNGKKPNLTFRTYRGSGATVLYIVDPAADLNQNKLNEIGEGFETAERVQQVEDNIRDMATFEENDNNQTKDVLYISLGTIVKSAYQIIYDVLQQNGSIAELEDLKRQIILFGNISVKDTILSRSNLDLTEIGGLNILHIPIEINTFKLFLLENIIKPQKDTYTLFSFIKDLITKLLVGVLNGTFYYNNKSDSQKNVSLATNIFSLGDNQQDNEPFTEISLAINSQSSQNIINTMKKYYINNVNTHSNYYNYFLIYDKFFPDYEPNNDKEKDRLIGIYHYTVGEDYGLLKAANFSRMDTPYLKEAKAVGQKTLYLGQFRDRYNVDITMVGNNIYHPGMMLFLHPSVEAVQTFNKDTSQDNPSFSQITGIGGYYFVNQVDSTISEDGYETKLSCIWQTDGYSNTATEQEEQDKCIQIISNDENKNANNLLVSLYKYINEEKLKQEQMDQLKEGFFTNPLMDTLPAMYNLYNNEYVDEQPAATINFDEE
jgi:hypothetical protein